MIVMEMEWVLVALIRVEPEVVLKLSPSPMTWNVETGSKVKVPRPLAEKSYRVETVKERLSGGRERSF